MVLSVSPIRSDRRATQMSRRKSSIESVVVLPLVPTSCCTNRLGSATFIEKRPKARRRTIDSSASR